MKRARFAALSSVVLSSVALYVAAMLGSGPAAAQQPEKDTQSLGRLFFTPQQRRELDRRRQLNIQEAIVVTEQRFSLNGHVARSSGKVTTWVNGAPVQDLYRPKDPTRVAIEPGEGEPPVQLKIGETLDKNRGEITDGLSGGRIIVNSKAAKGR